MPKPETELILKSLCKQCCYFQSQYVSCQEVEHGAAVRAANEHIQKIRSIRKISQQHLHIREYCGISAEADKNKRMDKNKTTI